MASSMYCAFQRTTALSANQSAELVFPAFAVGRAELALVAVEYHAGDGVAVFVEGEADARRAA